MRTFVGRLVPVLFLLACRAVFAAPGDAIYVEDFQDGDAGGWTQAGGNGTAGVGGFPPASGEASLFTCCGNVDLVSPPIDTGVAGAQLSLRVQRGAAGIGSDSPDGGREYLDLYFLDSTGAWVFQARYAANGAAGEMFNDVFTLDEPRFLHANFRVRLFQDSGDPAEDYWHLHEIAVVEASASGGIGSLCDDFSAGLARWAVNDFGGTGAAASTTQTANSQAHSLALFDGSLRVQSLPLDLADASGGTLNLWVRRGDDVFSEDPDSGEDLAIAYIDAGGNAQQLQVLAGDGVPGEVFNLAFSLPADALHGAFRLRIERYGNGAGGYWHIDDVCVDIQRTLDHFSIRHDGSGVNCQAEPVRIAAHDANHFVVENHTGNANLSTTTGNGDWSLLGGGGVLSNTGNGNASYTFATADRGVVLLGLRDTFVESVNMNATQGGVAEAVSEDDNLSFAASGFAFLVDGSSAPIGVQIADKPSDVAPGAARIELQAIRTDDETGACAAALNGSTDIALAFSCEDPATCSGAALTVNGNSVAANGAGSPTSFNNVALDFGAADDSTAELVLDYPNAGRVRLHARRVLQPSGESMAGSSSAFVVKPFGFHVDATGNPGATDASGDAYRKAGEGFDVTVTAVGWQATDDLDADGVPDGYGNPDPTDNAALSDNPALPAFGRETAPDIVELAARLAAPAGGANPGLAGDTDVSSFVDGAGSTRVEFGEAGIIEIVAALSDGGYFDAGDVVSRSRAVGRFTPDHFDVDIGSHGCNDTIGFTYSGQPLRLLTITAGNVLGGTVRNFDGAGGFARTVTLEEINGVAGGVVNGGVSALDFTNGVAALGGTPSGVAFAFTNVEHAPAAIAFRATDSDGVSSASHTEAGTQIRSARLFAGHANAPVLASAVSHLRLETFDGTDWRHETADSCTTLDLANLSLADHSGNLAAGESIIDTDTALTFLASGAGKVTLTAPGNGNDGSMTLHVAVDEWLEYDWDGTGRRAPSGVIRFFGIFRTEPGLIQRHEVVAR